MKSPYEYVMQVVAFCGGGMLVTIWLALIWLNPTTPPDWMVKGAFVLIALPTFVFGTIVLSDWLSYLRSRLKKNGRSQQD